MTRGHLCDERCVCPKCGGPLLYSEVYDAHACRNPGCRWCETPRMPATEAGEKKLVVRHRDGLHQIFGTSKGQPDSMIGTRPQSDSLYCLIQAKHRYYLYVPLMAAQLSNEFRGFDPRQR